MTPESFRMTLLQHDRDRNFQLMERLLTECLAQNRSVAIQSMDKLLSRAGGRMRALFFDVLIQDGKADLIPLLLRCVRTTRDQVDIEKQINTLSDMKCPEILEGMEHLGEGLRKECIPTWQRALNKLHHRFRDHHYMRIFAGGDPEQIRQVAESMLKSPQKSYVPFLNRAISGVQPEMCRQGVRVLRRLRDPSSFEAMLNATQTWLGRRKAILGLLSSAVFTTKGQVDATALLDWFASCSGEEQVNQAIEAALAGNRLDEARDLLVAPLCLTNPNLMNMALFFAQILTGDSVNPPERENLRTALKLWLGELTKTLCDLLLACGRLARRMNSPRYVRRVERLFHDNDPDRDILLASALCGNGSEPDRERLVALLKRGQESLSSHILDLLHNVPLESIPDAVLELAYQTDNAHLRNKALEFISRSGKAQPIFEQIFINGPLLVKSDVGRVVGEHKLKSCYRDILGFLHRRISDSFRVIVLESLAYFDSEETGLPVQQFMLPLYTLNIRLAAVETLFRAGGPDKMSLILKGFEMCENQRHMNQILEKFITLMQGFPIEEKEAEFLTMRPFWDAMLIRDYEPIRLKTLALLNRCEWAPDERSGWTEALQRALQTLVAERSEEEVEMIRILLERLAVRFKSEQKNLAMRRQFVSVLDGLDNDSRLARFQALRKLDWIFRPEMVQGSAREVQRLVKQIDLFLDEYIDDTQLEVLIIEIAGKIGHPFLRKKIRSYLNHDQPELAVAARKALAMPVNEVLMDNMIRRVFTMDDSQYMTNLVTVILKAEGYHVDGANEVRRGIQALTEQTYDLLILDLNMPGMRGVDFLRKIRNMDICPTFTFILTSVRTHEDLVEIFKVGVNGVVLKPFRGEDLLEKIKELKDNFR